MNRFVGVIHGLDGIEGVVEGNGSNAVTATDPSTVILEHTVSFGGLGRNGIRSGTKGKSMRN